MVFKEQLQQIVKHVVFLTVANVLLIIQYVKNVSPVFIYTQIHVVIPVVLINLSIQMGNVSTVVFIWMIVNYVL